VRIPQSRRVLLVVAASLLAVVLAATGAGAAYLYTGDVPRGTTVLGIDLGGMTRAEATGALTAGLARRSEELAAPVAVIIGDVRTEVEPEAVGLAVDVDATVAAAAEGSRRPWRAVTGRAVDPVVRVDPVRLDLALRETAEQVGEAMTLPRIRFEGTTPVPVYPEPGLGLDPERSAAALTAGWPVPPPPADGWVAPAAVTVPLVEVTPVTTAADVDRLLAELARPAVAAEVTITLPGDSSVTVSPEVIAASLLLEPDSNGEIIPEVDADLLRDGLADQLEQVETVPVNARFVLDGGQPRVRDAVPGELVDTDGLAADLLAVLPEPAPRRVEGVMSAAPADVTAADLDRLGVVEEISSFTTFFEGGLQSPRSQNIVLIADMVDGTLVEPGEVFSLNGHTGERTPARGFQTAPVIIDGRLQPATGGGNSQFTTTLFNSAYYAGLEIVENWPHSYYYSRYPAVIEATIFYPNLDLKFRNDSPYGVLITTSYTQNSVTVTMWGTKVWDNVTTEWGPRTNPVEPQTRYVEPDDSCIDTQGIAGFTQDAWRHFHRGGEVVHRERFSWSYDAQPEVICGEDPGGEGGGDMTGDTREVQGR
jgi:vancomycin resistance protein YoaR